MTVAMGTEGIIDRYVNFYTDFAFKKLFGTEMNKDLLISFLIIQLFRIVIACQFQIISYILCVFPLHIV